MFQICLWATLVLTNRVRGLRSIWWHMLVAFSCNVLTILILNWNTNAEFQMLSVYIISFRQKSEKHKIIHFQTLDGSCWVVCYFIFPGTFNTEKQCWITFGKCITCYWWTLRLLASSAVGTWTCRLWDFPFQLESLYLISTKAHISTWQNVCSFRIYSSYLDS